MTRDLLYWSGILICVWLLIGWMKWRFWDWMDERNEKGDS